MMYLSPRRLPVAAVMVALSAALLLLPGCGGGKSAGGAPEIANASQALTSLRVLREDLANGQGRLFTMAETLREATAPQDLALGPWFNRYRSQREGVRDLAMSLREGYANLQNAERVYISTWEQDLAAIADPELRQQSVDRRAALRDRFGRLGNDLDNTKQSFQPLLQQLSDLEVFLKNDLTATGVRQVRDRLEKAGSESEALGGKVSSDLAQLDSLIDELAPRK
ncbi:DUF2959 family protein [Phycisphaera mikurensis]|uniref:DUF2959 family protein n=1 Tax=Phycisphaera mikurensis (strain NBRC 102666 / KCTC 22515 / FYK2301M01) TaxID=1142394 RepID=I0ICF8_PHYMF|nr:DUF2959 family protein [Phycisphaera mikurensis]MBB6442178.1 hypothetical protein [Phycisphaera mikurensis]BAM02946.1 hypothetical protein PSMK_07870 [Phycisphaera mikurensis NBRC 102666]